MVNGKSITSLAKQNLSAVQFAPFPNAPVHKQIYTAYTGVLPAAFNQLIQNQNTAYQTASQAAAVVLSKQPSQAQPSVPPKAPSTISLGSLLGGGSGVLSTPATNTPTTLSPNSSYVSGLGGL